jgi:FKBP-type peptidyl-prolyl cis-trans isomerase SlyD
LQAGDKFDFKLDQSDAYGEYEDANLIDLERAMFEVEGKLDEKIIFEGNIVPLSDSDGNHYQAVVVKVSDTHVTVDLNHPLAGEDLHFKGSVLDVHEPTSEELTALMGVGCGCGCDDCHDEGCDCGC